MHMTQHFIANLTAILGIGKWTIANHDIELEINNELTNINDWLKINKFALNKKNI